MARWREERLTVNYRTPKEIMTVAADVLASVSPDERPPESVRSEGVPPARSGPARWPGRLRGRPRSRGPGRDRRRGRGPPSDHRAGRADRLDSPPAIPEAVPGDRPESLDSPAALLTVSQAKGLEFDRVIVADPSGILAQSQNGAHDLYVAITRATHRLTVVYEGSLPPSLRSLSGVQTAG